MEQRKNLFGSFSGLFFTLTIVSGLLLLVVGCNQDNSIVAPDDNSSLQEVLLKIAEEDEALQSFEPNFDESGELDFLVKTNTVIYPARIWRKIESVERTLDLTEDGDTTYGFSTKIITGTLFISASWDEFSPGDSGIVDTVIEKPFTTTVTRNLIFAKVNDTGNYRRDWKLVAISLPEGNTRPGNINITKLTVYLANGETLEVDSPNDYYLSRETNSDTTRNRRNRGRRGQRSSFPVLTAGDPVRVVVELESAYSDTDHVAMTFGANKFGRHRAKKRFELVSSDFNGQVYNRVYEGEFVPRRNFGFFHAIVKAVPYAVIHDDAAPVEKNSWGVPYAVQ